MGGYSKKISKRSIYLHTLFSSILFPLRGVDKEINLSTGTKISRKRKVRREYVTILVRSLWAQSVIVVKCNEFDYHFVPEKAGVKVQLDRRIQNE